MADPALAVHGQDCLYKCIQALNLLGISWPSVMEYLNKDMVHQTHQHIWWLKVQKHTPKVLQSDNGGNFTNARMKELLDNLHIKHITSLPYKPSSNGQVECFN